MLPLRWALGRGARHEKDNSMKLHSLDASMVKNKIVARRPRRLHGGPGGNSIFQTPPLRHLPNSILYVRGRTAVRLY
jgi:hypothetical protein